MWHCEYFRLSLQLMTIPSLSSVDFHGLSWLIHFCPAVKWHERQRRGFRRTCQIYTMYSYRKTNQRWVFNENTPFWDSLSPDRGLKILCLYLCSCHVNSKLVFLSNLTVLLTILICEKERETELKTNTSKYATIQSVDPLNWEQMFLASESIKNWK